MTNKNCLEGIRCPKCGDEDAFRIEAQITVYVTDDGTDDEGGHYAWDGESPCQCVACMHTATIKDFRLENQTKQEDSLRDAAPDMLEALELCEDALADLARLDDGTPSVSALHAARRVIAKAKGGAA